MSKSITKLLLAGLIIILSFGCDTTETNPLLVGVTENLVFNDISAAGITAATDEMLVKCNTIADSIGAIPTDRRTFENTMVPLDDLDACSSDLLSNMYLLSSVHPDSAIRAAADSALERLQSFQIAIAADDAVYNALVSYSNSTERQKLVGWQDRYVNAKLRDYRKSGHGLQRTKRERVADISDRLAKLGNQFTRNLTEIDDTLFVNENQIKGLPQNYRDELQYNADTWAIDMSYPSVFPFLRQAESNETRRRLQEKFLNRGGAENRKILRVILRDRHKLARILGYPSFAALIIEDKMAKSPEAVKEFLAELKSSLEPKVTQELEVLLDEKTRTTRKPAETIFQWERLFYINQYVKNRDKLDREEIREYFPADAVIEGLLTLTAEYFNLEFRNLGNSYSWHPDVTLYEVYTQSTGEQLGSFYLDLYPREHKYPHGAVYGLRTGKVSGDNYARPVFALITNYSRPGKNTPALLTHGEVVTLFHEFGHGLHQLFSQSELYYFSGTNVSQDFIEMPSQLFQNLPWEKEVLQRLTRHYQTGAAMPEEMMQKLMRTRYRFTALTTVNQLYLALLDLTLHGDYNPFSSVSTTDVVKRLMAENLPFPYMPGTYPEASFPHLAAYPAGYYGYLWSNVYAQDIYSVLTEDGSLDLEQLQRFRDIILASDGSQDEFASLREFLGREPQAEAFVKSLGL